MRLPLRGKSFVTLISAYAPTMTNSDEEKERFYGDLDKTIASALSSDKLLIMGDFNARVGRDNVTWQKVLGSHGVEKENSNGNLLLNECINHSLAITNTHYRLPAKKRTSWMYQRSNQWHLIDYVVVRQRDMKDVCITESMR